MSSIIGVAVSFQYATDKEKAAQLVPAIEKLVREVGIGECYVGMLRDFAKSLPSIPLPASSFQSACDTADDISRAMETKEHEQMGS